MESAPGNLLAPTTTTTQVVQTSTPKEERKPIAQYPFRGIVETELGPKMVMHDIYGDPIEAVKNSVGTIHTAQDGYVMGQPSSHNPNMTVPGDIVATHNQLQAKLLPAMNAQVSLSDTDFFSQK